MNEVKIYEIEPFRFEFLPEGGPFKGTLYVTHPETEPYIDRINVSDTNSRRKYAESATAQIGIGEEELKEALNALATRRHEEVAAAIENRGEGNSRREIDDSISEADVLVLCAEDDELFYSPEGKAYATFHVGDHEETWPVEGKRFERRLRQRYYELRRKAPGAQAVRDAVATIVARALFEGHEEKVFLRVAGHEGAVYVDLCNEAWEAVEITPAGWRVVAAPPVKFIRNSNSAPLPYPERGGSMDDLRPFLNIRKESDFKLIVGWLVGALNPTGPYPLLEILGEQGTAKSTTERLLRSLVDPAVSPLRALPRSERDLVIAASLNWVLAFDNLSYVRSEISDAMCRLATGGGFGTRTLYTDDEETLFNSTRPQMVNGINAVALRGDLQERSVSVILMPIPKEHRREERRFRAEFEAVRPRILGALFDAVSGALSKIESVSLEGLPRMADFAVWVTAAEPALGWEPGAFMEAYSGNRKAATEAALDGDPVAVAVEKFLNRIVSKEWSGTSQDLLEALTWQVSDEIQRSKSWPKAANILSRRMNRLAPLLRETGIVYEEREEGHGKKKVKTLRKIDDGHDDSERANANNVAEGQAAGDDQPLSSDVAEDVEEPNDFGDDDFDFDDPEDG